jgi:excisionase family DNA binding protein
LGKIKDLRNHCEPWVAATDLADYWRVSRKQIYKQIDAGTLKAIRLGPRLLRISLAEAVRFEEDAKMSASPEEERKSGPAPRVDDDLEGVSRDSGAEQGASRRLSVDALS